MLAWIPRSPAIRDVPEAVRDTGLTEAVMEVEDPALSKVRKVLEEVAEAVERGSWPPEVASRGETQT